jgi:hypothetical protein
MTPLQPYLSAFKDSVQAAIEAFNKDHENKWGFFWCDDFTGYIYAQLECYEGGMYWTKQDYAFDYFSQTPPQKLVDLLAKDGLVLGRKKV